jgi:hypothetical protein
MSRWSSWRSSSWRSDAGSGRIAARLSSTVGGCLGGDAHGKAERKSLALGGQPGEQIGVVGCWFAGGIGPAGGEYQRGQGLVLGAGVGPDRAGRGVQHVGVVDHLGPLAHVAAEQILVPGALEGIGRWLVAGPVDIDDGRDLGRAHRSLLCRRGRDG